MQPRSNPCVQEQRSYIREPTKYNLLFISIHNLYCLSSSNKKTSPTPQLWTSRERHGAVRSTAFTSDGLHATHRNHSKRQQTDQLLTFWL